MSDKMNLVILTNDELRGDGPRVAKGTQDVSDLGIGGAQGLHLGRLL